MTTRYEGSGKSVQAALEQAHMQIPPSDRRDFTVSKVVEWGMQFGGFISTTTFYVVVEEDPDAPFRSGSTSEF